MRKQKPTLTFWQIRNMCFGFLRLQFGFAIQRTHVNRILQPTGSSFGPLPLRSLPAPASALNSQPVIYSPAPCTPLPHAASASAAPPSRTTTAMR